MKDNGNRKQAILRLAVFMGVLMPLAGCCVPGKVVLSGLRPTDEDGLGRQHGKSWEYKRDRLHLEVQTDNWEDDSQWAPEAWRGERTVLFTVKAPVESDAVFNPSQVILSSDGHLLTPMCLIQGNPYRNKNRVCNPATVNAPVPVSGRTLVRVEFPVALVEGSTLLINGLTQGGQPVHLPPLRLNVASFRKTTAKCLAIND